MFLFLPNKKTSKHHDQLVLHSFLRLQFHLQMSGEFCWKFGSTLKLLVQLRSFGGTLTRWKSTAQWRSTSLRKASFSQIHPLESTIKQLIFSTWASSHGVWSHHGLVGILSARPERLQKSLINRIKKLSQSASNKYCLTILMIKLGGFSPPTSSLCSFFRDANLPASESVRSSARSAPRTNPCLVFPSVQRWFTSSLFWLTNAGLEHTRKLTWNPRMKIWKMIFLLRGVIFRFNVSFQGSQGSTLDSKFYKAQTYNWRILRFFTFTVPGFSHWDGHLQMRKTPEFTMNSLKKGKAWGPHPHTLTSTR